jgi:hypothetical protein
MRVVRRFDWLRRLGHMSHGEAARIFPEIDTGELEAGLRVRFPDGSLNVGVDAVRSIALRTPLGFVPALLLFLPGVHWLGARAYGWVAQRRYRLSGSTCTPGSSVTRRV